MFFNKEKLKITKNFDPSKPVKPFASLALSSKLLSIIRVLLGFPKSLDTTWKARGSHAVVLSEYIYSVHPKLAMKCVHKCFKKQLNCDGLVIPRLLLALKHGSYMLKL